MKPLVQNKLSAQGKLLARDKSLTQDRLSTRDISSTQDKPLSIRDKPLSIRDKPLSDLYLDTEIINQPYAESPLLYWYESKGATTGQYVAVWRIGRQFIGYLYDPPYNVIERYDLRFVGYGDIDFIESLHK